MSQDGSSRNEALRGLLSALWSFLQHPAVHLEDHLTTVEERLKSLEARVVGDLHTAVDTRVAGIHARLDGVKKRVVEDLKRELHHLILVGALVAVSAVS